MKVSKKTLALVLSIGTIFLMGCNNKNISDTSETLNSENAMVEEVNNEESVEEEVNTGITEEEALKLVENKIHAVTPEVKLKVRGKEFCGNDEVYVVEYDTPFATDITFNVSLDGEKIEMYDYEYYNNDISRYEEKIKELEKQSSLSKDEIKNLYIKSEKELMAVECAFLSENQLNNLELAVDYMVKTPYNYCWVYRYPIEDFKHEWVDENKCTTYNSKSTDDKYGYIYLDPYKKEYTAYIKAEGWSKLYS